MSKIFIPALGAECWKRLLEQPERQWKTAYSAKALAHCWQENPDEFPESVSKLFVSSGLPLFENIQLLFAFPEYQVPLPPPGEEPSHNDLFVIARGEGQLVSITVEGKVSEQFDKLVSDWAKDASAAKATRLSFLCNRLGLGVEDVSGVHYQLLHRTVSAMLMAKKLGARNALMLVHSFSQDNERFDEYAKFAQLMGVAGHPDAVQAAKSLDGIALYLGWVKGESKWLEA